MSRIELRWSAVTPDFVTIWAMYPDGGQSHPLATTELDDLDHQLEEIKREKWQGEIRDLSAQLRSSREHEAMTKARRRRQESSRRFEQVPFPSHKGGQE